MAYELIIEPEAQKEIDDAISWYEGRQKGLGLEFLQYLNGYFETLKSNKISFAIKRNPFFRELSLKRFPFVIIYEIHQDFVIVYSVFYTHRDPGKKFK